MLRILILAIGLSLGAGALAQVRTIPAEAKRGAIRHVQDTWIEMNGRAMRLSAGAQIRDPSNKIIQPAALPAGVLVKYTLDSQGFVHRVWILTLQEVSQPDQRR